MTTINKIYTRKVLTRTRECKISSKQSEVVEGEQSEVVGELGFSPDADKISAFDILSTLSCKQYLERLFQTCLN